MRDLYYEEDDAESSEEENDMMIPGKEMAARVMPAPARLEEALGRPGKKEMPQEEEKDESLVGLPRVEAEVGDAYIWGEAPEVVSELRLQEPWARVAAGYGCAAAVSASGRLHALAGDILVDKAPPAENIAHVALGRAHALALGADGAVYATGAGSDGQLGCGSKSLAGATSWCKVPTFGPRDQSPQNTAVDVACGAAHSVVCTRSGDVFSWGAGFKGQTGHAPKVVKPPVDRYAKKGAAAMQASIDRLPVPRQVFALAAKAKSWPHDPIRRVACGHDFTLALSASGVLWAWGEGTSGELGVGRLVTCLKTPTRVQTDRRFVSIACGWAHSLAIDAQTSDVYAWGLNTYGQLGLGFKAHPTPSRSEGECLPDFASSPDCAPAPAMESVKGSLVSEAEAPVATGCAAVTCPEGPCPETVDQVDPKYAAEPRRILGLAASAVWAGGHSSAAIRVGDGVVVAWGSPKRGPASQHSTAAPIRAPVVAFHQRCAAVAGDFCLTVCEILDAGPKSLPSGGGSKLVLHGAGFGQSDLIKVAFSRGGDPLQAPEEAVLPDGENSPAVVETVDARFVGDAAVECVIPDLAPGDYDVRIAMNGRDFARRGSRIQIFDPPALKAVVPRAVAALESRGGDASVRTLRLSASGLHSDLDPDMIRVKFALPDQAFETCVAAKLVQEETVGGEDEEENDDEMSLTKKIELGLECEAPVFPTDAAYPMLARISLSLNAQDFGDECVEVMVHDAAIDALEPDCAPIDADEPPTLRVRGHGFFDSPEGDCLARLSGDVQAELALACIDDGTLGLDTAPLVGELGRRADPEQPVNSGDAVVVGEEEKAGEDPEDQGKAFWRCELAASLDGFASTLPGAGKKLALYRTPDKSRRLEPASAPASGTSTSVAIQLPPEYLEHDYARASVRLRSSDKILRNAVDATVRAAVVDEPTGGRRLVFSTPDLGPSPFVDPEPPEDVPRDDDEDPGGAQPDETQPRQEAVPGRRIEVAVELALDGIHFSAPFNQRFVFYETPVVPQTDCGTLEPGAVLRLDGSAFPLDAPPLIRLTCDHRELSVPAALDDSRASLLVTLPDDLTPLFPPAGTPPVAPAVPSADVDAPADDQPPLFQVRVQVSFNAGHTFSNLEDAPVFYTPDTRPPHKTMPLL